MREYKNLSRKELAYKANFSLNSISTGISRNSVPSADVAYRIAQVLGVSVEYLLTEKEPNAQNIEKEFDEMLESDIELLIKFRNVVNELNRLDEKTSKLIENLVHSLSIRIGE